MARSAAAPAHPAAARACAIGGGTGVRRGPPFWPPAIVASRLAAGAVAAALSAVAIGGNVAAAREPSVAAVARCEGARIAVHGGGAADAASICAGGRDAFGFFDERKLDTSIDVDVEVTAVLPDKADAAALGCYHPARKRVYLLPLAEFTRRGKWFGLAPEPALYRSLATHEIAHAIVTCGLGAAPLSTAAMEYIGYVAMLSAMPADLRRRVLEQQPGSGFDAPAQINTFVYLIDPARFAVQSYRHYQRPENGDHFLRDLLSGRILLE